MVTLTSWNPLGHYRPVTGLLYLYLYSSNSVYDSNSVKSTVTEQLYTVGIDQYKCINITYNMNYFWTPLLHVNED